MKSEHYIVQTLFFETKRVKTLTLVEHGVPQGVVAFLVEIMKLASTYINT